MIKKILISLGLTLLFITPVFAATEQYYDDLEEMMNKGQFTGDVYSPGSTIGVLNMNSDGEFTTTSKVTSPKWCKYKNNYYLVLESDSDKMEDENGKTLNYYRIDEGSILSDTIAVIKYQNKYYAYYFNDEGICSDSIGKNNKAIEFNSSGKATANYEIQYEESEMPVKVYEKEDIEIKNGVHYADHNSKMFLHDGYIILTTSTEGKYKIYKLDSNGKQNGTAHTYTLQECMNYLSKQSNVVSATTNKYVENNQQQIKEQNNNANKTIDLTNKNYTSIKELLVDFSIKVNNGKMKLSFKDKDISFFTKEGSYIIDNKIYTIDNTGKIIKEENITSDNKLISNKYILENAYIINIGKNKYIVGKDIIKTKSS